MGVGSWGKNLLRNFYNLPQVQVPIVCDSDKKILTRLATEYSGLETCQSVEPIYARDDYDAVVIATPPEAHYQLAREFLLRGKHVFVEKPMVLELRHGEELTRLAREQRRILMVGHILKYHPAFERVKAMIDAGELGEIYYIYTSRVNLGVIRQTENSLWSFAPHDISVILMFMNQTPIRVVSTGQSFIQPGIEDVVFTTLHFADGKMAHIHVSWLDPHKIRKVTVVGSQKMAVIDDMEASEKIRVYDKGVNFTGNYSAYGEYLSLRIGDILIPNVKNVEPLKMECQHFIDCILNNRTPRSDGEDGLAVVRILNAAQESLKHGGKPIDI
ncbi:MAG: Gfo/Idh/MocA family oxidoreductase [candidate division KSB1 bacterium]|nr:Gfo/Idh/MocA family oxidoreductase [candidate division KSB1 bacterium]MDZ7341757.1 Gfo/Idh/MocA family oxidoreductase [candidate division KSB1 bacterium]